MSILDLQTNDGFEPKRVASTNGGEYASPCPACGGDDRFRSWPEQDRYWCRQCEKSGDSIQYLRCFHGQSFRAAADQVGKVIPGREQASTYDLVRVTPTKRKPEPPGTDWSDMAFQLVQYANENLMKDPVKLKWLKDERGISSHTVERHKLGWIDKNIFDLRARWGLETILKEDGQPKKLLIPSGLVIPCNESGKIIRIRIRRDNPGDFSRYYVLPGSSSTPMKTNPIMRADPSSVLIVESELDAILLDQEINEPLSIVGLGSVTIRPDEELTSRLRSAPFIFVALDNDDAGAKQAVNYWMPTFNNAVIAPIPTRFGKDPTEAYINGLDLNLWFSAVTDLGHDNKISELSDKDTEDLGGWSPK